LLALSDGKPDSTFPESALERDQKKWEPVLRKAIKLARMAYTYPRFALYLNSLARDADLGFTRDWRIYIAQVGYSQLGVRLTGFHSA
jgi:hypothetical protein